MLLEGPDETGLDLKRRLPKKDGVPQYLAAEFFDAVLADNLAQDTGRSIFGDRRQKPNRRFESVRAVVPGHFDEGLRDFCVSGVDPALQGGLGDEHARVKRSHRCIQQGSPV